MAGQHYHHLNKLKLYILISLFTFNISCSKEKGRAIYICIYGKYNIGTKVSLQFNNKKVYEHVIENSDFQERRLPAFYLKSKSANIRLTVDKKDTVFRIDLNKKIYLNMAYSPHHKQFQVVNVDSIGFRRSGNDVIYP